MNAEEKMLDYVGASSNKSIFVIVALITSVAFIGVDLPSGAIAYIFLLALLGLLFIRVIICGTLEKRHAVFSQG